MIARHFSFHFADTKLIEKIVEDNHAAINHVVLADGDALPEHATNSNVYLIIIRGEATIRLEDEGAGAYPAGSIVHIPYRTRMNLSNHGSGPLDFFIVKAPGPQAMNAVQN